ncbi:hypothetical protein POM88_047704 [Heracleum sosnowskyi]|uniref:F-box associated beta-propeller type 3 domain-containing protein n=1 Tax=Heracleum sosnowskyi TaxID=360622 RepID=A0AAD8GUV5_9APIA|nr:hypothetical protein POM88_047704 [Heracleum sosnowskyi]
MADRKASPLMITKENSSCRPRFAAIESKYYLHVPVGLKVIGSCNGIICLVKKDVHCCLWNPFTRHSKELPRFLDNQTAMDEKSQAELAFGFDSISKDYKVIRFIRPTITTSVAPVLQLYSTNTDSWKEIHVRDTSASRVMCHPKLKFGPVINGVLYVRHMRQSDVFDFEGSVAVVLRSVPESSKISLWTLDNSTGGEVFWTRKFIVHYNLLWTCSYLGRGLFFGKKEARGRTKVLYNNTKKEFKTFPRLAKKPSAVLKYTETLASVQGFIPNLSMTSMFYP